MNGAGCRSSSRRSPRASASPDDKLHLVPRELGQVEVDQGGGALRAGEHQQAVDELLAPVHGLGDGRTHLPQFLLREVGIAESHVDLGADDGEGRAQLVRGIGYELLLGA